MSSHILSAVLLGVSSNLDCLAVGLSYGLRKKQVGLVASLIIGLLSFSGTIFSMILGRGVAQLLPSRLPNLAGGLLIFLIGLLGLLRCMLGSGENAGDLRQDLSWKEAMTLGLVLALNNAGLGMGASMTGMGILSTACLVLLFCLLFLYGGNRLGKLRLTERAGRLTEYLAHGLMLVLGIYEMFL